MLVDFFENRGSAAAVSAGVQGLKAGELADLFVDVSFLGSALRFLSEAHWLQSQKAPVGASDFSQFIKDSFESELSPILFLRDILMGTPVSQFKNIAMQVSALEKTTVEQVKNLDSTEQKVFAERSLNLMSSLFAYEAFLENEKKAVGLNLGLSLYRSFDALDEVFGFNYTADKGMKTDLQISERLYEGAGVGVQSSYATVLNALREISPVRGARFVDLGAGYGRVGLAVGHLRPDIDFVGYEYVPHRVEIANAASQRFGMKGHVQFHTQDLAAKDFKIPEADVYYMYDPFSEETYHHVLSQLIVIAKKRKIVIATKGNARAWLLDIAKSQNWAWPQELDAGNLCIFRS